MQEQKMMYYNECTVFLQFIPFKSMNIFYMGMDLLRRIYFYFFPPWQINNSLKRKTSTAFSMTVCNLIKSDQTLPLENRLQKQFILLAVLKVTVDDSFFVKNLMKGLGMLIVKPRVLIVIMYPFQASYWCGHSVSPYSLEDDETTPLLRRQAEYFESEPTGIESGIQIRNLTKVKHRGLL